MRNTRGRHYAKSNLFHAFAIATALVLISGLFGGFIAGTIPWQTHWLVGGLTFWIASGMLLTGAVVLIFIDGNLGLLLLLTEGLIYALIILSSRGLFIWLEFVMLGFLAFGFTSLINKIRKKYPVALKF
jgi:hypothetical protein